MHVLILEIIAGIALAASTQAAPLSPNPASIELGAKPPIELVSQGCGWGWHRVHWQNRWGYWLWLAQGFAVEILGAPNNTSLNGRRQTEAYADAIGRAVDFARTRARVPVWLVGTSAGTTGAANGAARLTGRIAGLVMTSSVSRTPL